MYVGPWQEYKLAKVIQVYQAEQKHDDAHRPISNRSRASDRSKLSAATAPHKALHETASQKSDLSSSVRSAITDIDEWRRVRRGLSSKKQPPRAASKRTHTHGHRAKPAKADISNKDLEQRSAHKARMLRLYTNQVDESAHTAPQVCPHCSTPDTKFCSATGLAHSSSALDTPAAAPTSPKRLSPQRSTLSSSAISQLMHAREGFQSPAAPPPLPPPPPPPPPPPQQSTFNAMMQHYGQSSTPVVVIRDSQAPAPSSEGGYGVRRPLAERAGVEGLMLSGGLSTAATYGNVLSPVGSAAGSPGVPKNRPAQSEHLDDDETLLRVSHTLNKKTSAAVPAPSPALPQASPSLYPSDRRTLSPNTTSETDVAELLQWTANLSEPSWKPSTPNVY